MAEIQKVSTEEGAAYGAGLLAAVGAGMFDSVESATTEAVSTTPAAGPTETREIYREPYERYASLYPALKPSFDATP